MTTTPGPYDTPHPSPYPTAPDLESPVREQTENEWNPLATVEPVRIPLEVSGGRAAIVCRRWAGRERLAYEDTIALLLTDDGRGGDTVRIGALRLLATSLTVVGSEGFPPAPDGRVFLTGTREERERDLLSITDPATYEEIRTHANRIQPLPKADGDDDETGGQGDAGDDDPSQTPPTPPAAVLEPRAGD